MTARAADVPRVALSITEAAEAVGYSDKTIRQAIASGELVARYGTGSKPVIRVVDLDAWLLSLPTQSRRT